jgi:diaminohydroxyphosphoribosylaminopyrimidine deaminase/5-amino-6-(5-phosphoribosylamino)uracil reductase
VHRLRAESDAVVVGSGTARADDPQLSVRGIDGARQPLRVVVDTHGTAVRPGARVLDDTAPTLIAVAENAVAAGAEAVADGGADAVAAAGAAGAGVARGPAERVRLPRTAAGVDIEALLADLYARGVRSVLLEGGPTLAGAFVAAGTVVRVIGYLAPAFLGAGPAVLSGGGITTLTQALRPDVTEIVRVGTDLRITGTLPAKEH